MNSRRERLRRLIQQAKTPTTTNIDDLWSKPVDMNDFNIIFNNQYRNEYDNSFRYVQSYDLSILKSSIQIPNRDEPNINSLLCTEELAPSDSEETSVQDERSNNNSKMITEMMERSKNQEREIDYSDELNPTWMNTKKEPKKIVNENQEQSDNQQMKLNHACEFNVTERKETKELSANAEARPRERVRKVRSQEQEKEFQKSYMKDNNCTNLDIFHDSDDSCMDKDYIPDSYESSTDEENAGKRHKIAYQHSENNLSRNKIAPITVPIERNRTEQMEIVPAMMQNGAIESGNLNNELSETNAAFTRSGIQHNINRARSEETDEQEVENIPTTIQTGNRTNPNDQTTRNNKGFTKSGNPRKRRRFEEQLKERMAKKIEEKRNKHFLKDACGSKCKKQCVTKIDHEQRRQIHSKYVALSHEAQGLFIKCLVDEKPVKRRLQTGNTNRKCTYVYYLKDRNLTKTEVCKVFFLATLGYSKTNDARVRSAMKKDIDCQKDKRGTYGRSNLIDRDVIKQHIKTYNPCISHYRREHAPNRLYLPSDISITLMHSQFLELRPDIPVSLEYYRLVVKKDLNISFAHLGNEECELCAIFENHNSDHKDNPNENCETCNGYLEHHRKYTESRATYQEDLNLKNTTSNIIYSGDLQKVIMLPRMEQFKSAIFCPRIIAFNESFVPLGTSRPSDADVPFAVLWNEAIAGRGQHEIISTFQAFFMRKRDAENITVWLDNCAAQNKNWAFLSFLVGMVNSDSISAKTITIKYFEPGHTFMSADSFHKQVEQCLKKKRKVYDFSDFVDCVRGANSGKTEAKVMSFSDFHEHKDFTSQHKLRKLEPRIYLKDIVCCRVERELFQLKYKTSHYDEDFKTMDFLQTKIVKSTEMPPPKPRTEERGIDKVRKAGIVEKLVPLMPQNRRAFWLNLPVSSTVVTDESESV